MRNREHKSTDGVGGSRLSMQRKKKRSKKAAASGNATDVQQNNGDEDNDNADDHDDVDEPTDDEDDDEEPEIYAPSSGSQRSVVGKACTRARVADTESYSISDAKRRWAGSRRREEGNEVLSGDISARDPQHKSGDSSLQLSSKSDQLFSASSVKSQTQPPSESGSGTLVNLEHEQLFEVESSTQVSAIDADFDICLTDDDDYAGVDNVDVSEEDDQELTVLEEKYIIDSEQRSGLSRRDSQSSSESEFRRVWLDQGAFDYFPLYGEEEETSKEPPPSRDDTFVHNSNSHNKRKGSESSAKRVRFQEHLPGSETETSDTEADSAIFPDLFHPGNSQHLPSSGGSHVHARSNSACASDTDSSYWDFTLDNGERRVDSHSGQQFSQASDESVESEPGSSGYECMCQSG
jgi:hypothetical protein